MIPNVPRIIVHYGTEKHAEHLLDKVRTYWEHFKNVCVVLVNVNIVNSTPNIINDLWHYCNTFPIGIKTKFFFDYLHFFVDRSGGSFMV